MGWLSSGPAGGSALGYSDDGPARLTAAVLWDDFFEGYLAWREACVDLRNAYETWDSSPLHEVPLGFAAYVAALDREEAAATACQAAAARIYARYT